MASPEGKRSGLMEGYKNFNKITFVGALGVAAVGAVFAPSLIAPALTLAAVDGAQIYAINKWQNRKKGTNREMRTSLPNITRLFHNKPHSLIHQKAA